MLRNAVKRVESRKSATELLQHRRPRRMRDQVRNFMYDVRQKYRQLREKAQGACWVLSERLRYGHTLKEQRLGGVTRYH